MSFSVSPPPRCSPKLHPRVRVTRSVNASAFHEHLNVSTEVEVEDDEEEEEEEVLETTLEMEEEEGEREEEERELVEDEEDLEEKEAEQEEEDLEKAEEVEETNKDTFTVFPLLVEEPSAMTHSAHYDDGGLLGISDEPTPFRHTPPPSPLSSPLSELSFRAKKHPEGKRRLETWAKFIQEEHDGVEVSKILIREEEVGRRREARQPSRISRSPKKQSDGDEKRKGGKKKGKKRRKGKRGK